MSINYHNARKTIKAHLTKRGNQPITISSKGILYWWKRLNAAVFFGKLPLPESIVLIYYESEHAWTIPQDAGRIRLAIHPTFASRTLFLCVLVHEMVHAWQHLSKRTQMGHNKTFYRWANRIRRTTSLRLKRVL